MWYPNFSVLLIRNVNLSRQDDVIQIRPHATYPMLYTISYTDATIENSRIQTFGTRRDVYQYLETIFRGQLYDDDPYEYVQVTPPGFPAVLIPREQILKQSVQDNVFSMLRQTFTLWENRRFTQTSRRQSQAAAAAAEQPPHIPNHPPGGEEPANA
jgi:hypothetical protein